MKFTKTPRSAPEICLFSLGQVVATPGALDLLDRTATNGLDLLQRHQHGDWGSVPPEDAEANVAAVVTGCRILSSYYLNGSERLWIITEWDRSITTLLLPDEY
jgi:hypothetical protein